jgi:hypothetical protein
VVHLRALVAALREEVPRATVRLVTPSWNDRRAGQLG